MDAPVVELELGLVKEKLAEYGELTRTRLSEFLPDQEPKKYLYDLVAEYPNRAGSMLRPALHIATAKSFGAPVEETLNTAAAIELMHNAMLVHDDIEDISDMRRGAPSLHVQAGVPLAINAGDALGLLCLQPLLANTSVLPAQLALSILEEAIETMFQTVEGQAWELGWRRDNVCDLRPVDYLQMINKKTSWYTTIFPCRAGASIGLNRTIDPDEFVKFGYFLGATFQIQDDILNVTSDREMYGKDHAGDITEGKRTLMMVHLFDNASAADKEDLKEYLGLSYPSRTKEDKEWVIELMERYGSLEYSKTYAKKYAGAALFEFEQVYSGLPETDDRKFIENLIIYTLERKL